ncbi:hypothetical protein [Flavobacterium panacagri]|uniref:hypothetical protein n=1 Tax=Flavobacterium panacagri TaxID=3034146 RepID=UPI0025A4D9EF|nr:hypothetical protein [Flavobacterium panacagri]
MKYSFLLFLLIGNFVFSQTETQIEIDSIPRITFEINSSVNVSDIRDIDFTKEKPKCEFELKGKIPLKYVFFLENDSIASLHQFKNNELKFQENLDYQPFMWLVDDNLIFSNFKIMDFDYDGDDDLVCWVHSNVNGNEWTVIFINDQKQQKLVRLYNTADKTDIWDRPRFDKKTNTINTELYGSVFGTSEESSYRLQDDLTVIPLKKHFQDRTGKRMYDYEYVGKNGKWKLISKTSSKN